MDEVELLTRTRQFDRQALAEVYSRYSDGLYVYAYRLLGDAQSAEDCVSETFSRFLGALEKGQGPQNHMQAYLYRIAHNWITDQYRRQPAILVALDDERYTNNDTPERQAATNLLQQQVREALQQLTPDQRQVILLKYLEGWDNAEVAAAIQKPVGAVKALQHRAIRALKRIFDSQKIEE